MTGVRRCRWQRGFTLVELMVVIVIIGIIVTFVGFSMGGDPRDEAMEQEAQRLVALVGLAAETAVLEAQELAIRFEPDSYSFLMLQESGWLAPQDNDIFRTRILPPGMELVLRVDGSDSDEPEQEELPQVFVLSSGELTPFEVEFTLPELDRYYRVTGELMGNLVLEGPLE